MSADRNELHELVERLPDDQLTSAAADLRGRLTHTRASRTTRPFAWIGVGVTTGGQTDVSADTDSYLAAGFGQSSL